MYYRARYYNPNIGRFVSEDPSKIALEFYMYADNSPSDSIDPLGLYTVVDSVTMTPHSTREKLDDACKPYLTAGECAGIDGTLSWNCTCSGGLLYKLETTITLSGTINYFDGQLPIRPAFDKMFKYGAPKDAAKRHVETYHTKIALGSLEPLIKAYEAIPYFSFNSCAAVGIMLSSKYSDYFHQELIRTRDEEHKQRRPRIRVRTTW
jgi:hypothetical protein